MDKRLAKTALGIIATWGVVTGGIITTKHVLQTIEDKNQQDTAEAVIWAEKNPEQLQTITKQCFLIDRIASRILTAKFVKSAAITEADRELAQKLENTTSPVEIIKLKQELKNTNPKLADFSTTAGKKCLAQSIKTAIQR